MFNSSRFYSGILEACLIPECIFSKKLGNRNWVSPTTWIVTCVLRALINEDLTLPHTALGPKSYLSITYIAKETLLIQ